MPLNSTSGAAELQQRTADPVSEDVDDALREMAQHRGFKLLKSRRRKPGVGDFGRFGLADASGKPVMGVGPDGLTALAEEVKAFLRTARWAYAGPTTVRSISPRVDACFRIGQTSYPLQTRGLTQ